MSRMEPKLSETPERVVHCCACHLLVTLSSTAAVGAVLSCPFCQTRMVLREMTVFVAEPVVEA
jgi:hypothetical protein